VTRQHRPYRAFANRTFGLETALSKTLLAAVIVAAGFMYARPAAAQTAPVQRWSLGVEGGAEAVEHVGGLGGAQLGIRLTSRLDLFGEAVYLQDIVSRRQLGAANTIATYLTDSQGQPASGDLRIPAWTGSVGLRFFLKSHGAVRVYLTGQAGAAHATFIPSFTLAGGDVTKNLPAYGIAAGSDLAGETTKPVAGGGLGVMVGQGAWYFDASLRVLSVQFDGQASNVKTIAFGLGRRF
jgi:hypothetical protein